MQNSNISWTDHTFNPWIGCTKVSSACDHCYAEAWAERFGDGHLWNGARRITVPSNWRKPIKWNELAKKTGIRARVFCASLADVFDNQVPEEWRANLWNLVERTPFLDWLLLTKRPQNIKKMLPENWDAGYSNVWLGCTVENQVEAERRIPALTAVPARLRFLSCEPLLGPLDPSLIYGIDWVIVGGESGLNARPMHPQWVKSLRDQCAEAGVAFHFKQWGLWQPHTPQAGGDLGGDVRKDLVRIVHPGGETDVEVSEKTGGRSTLPGSRYMKKSPSDQHATPFLEGRTWREFPCV